MQVRDTFSVDSSWVWEGDEVRFVLRQVTLGRTEPLCVRKLCELLAVWYHADEQAAGAAMLD